MAAPLSGWSAGGAAQLPEWGKEGPTRGPATCKLEVEGIHQFVLELMARDKKRPLNFECNQKWKEQAASRLVLPNGSASQLVKALRCRFNIVERQTPGLDWPGDDLENALATYRGLYVSRASAMAMGNERIALVAQRYKPFATNCDSDAPLPIDESSANGAPADWFLKATEPGEPFALPWLAYGRRLGFEKRLADMQSSWVAARESNDKLIACLKRILQSFDAKLVRFSVYEEVHAMLTTVLDGSVPTIDCHDRVEMRVELVRRLKYWVHALNAREELVRLSREARHSRKLEVARFQRLELGNPSQERESLMLWMLATPDILERVLEELGPSDAASFALAYLGSCKDAPDPLIVEAIKKRFPRLHIFSILDTKYASERFPHHINVDGSGVIYKAALLHIPIGFVTSRRRESVRAEGRAKDLLALKSVEGQFVESLPDLLPEEVGDPEKDHGYKAGEDVLLTYDGHMSHPSSTPRPWVRNNSWRIKKTALDLDNQLTQADALKYFDGPPELTVRVVHAESREPVIRDHAHGGLEPCADLRVAKTKMTLCAPNPNDAHGVLQCLNRSSHWSRPHKCDRGPGPPNDPNWTRFTGWPTGDMQAVMARFWPSCLSEQHAGHKFRIVVECTGKQRSDPSRSFSISAETPPYTFQCDKRAKPGRARRKASTPTSSPSLAKQPRH